MERQTAQAYEQNSHYAKVSVKNAAAEDRDEAETFLLCLHIGSRRSGLVLF